MAIFNRYENLPEDTSTLQGAFGLVAMGGLPGRSTPRAFMPTQVGLGQSGEVLDFHRSHTHHFSNR